MKHFKPTKMLLASAVLGLAVSSPVHADLFAYAKTTLDNFVILGSDGNPLDYGGTDLLGDFTQISVTSSTDMVGVLTGTPGFNFNQPPVAGQDNDFPASCLSTTGDCNILTENTFNNPPAALLSGAQGKDYITADQIEIGSPIENTPGFPAAADATIGSIAVGSLSATTASGSANVNNELSGTFTFELTQDQGVTFEGDVNSYLEAFASAGELSPGSAAASSLTLLSL